MPQPGRAFLPQHPHVPRQRAQRRRTPVSERDKRNKNPESSPVFFGKKSKKKFTSRLFFPISRMFIGFVVLPDFVLFCGYFVDLVEVGKTKL